MSVTQWIIAPIVGAASLFALYEAGDVILPPPIEGNGAYEEQVAPGETVMVDWQVNKNVDCPGYSSRVWVGEDGFSLSEPVQATSLPQGYGEYNIPTSIPEMAPDGQLSLLIRGHFDCNGNERYFELGPVEFFVADSALEVAE